MNAKLYFRITLTAMLAVASMPASACGEGMINAGKGLPYQAYLAPRPATVLVYASPDPTATEAERSVLYAGLQKAGHKVTVVGDARELASALRDRHFDVVITAFDAVDTVATAAADAGGAAAQTKLLPVVARRDRNLPQLHSRFDAFVLDGASLGQYLKMIGKSLASNAP